MVAATYDQGDAAGNAHACDGSSVGQLHGTLRLSGETKGTEFFIGREEMPLSLGRIAPSLTKAARERFFSS